MSKLKYKNLVGYHHSLSCGDFMDKYLCIYLFNSIMYFQGAVLLLNDLCVVFKILMTIYKCEVFFPSLNSNTSTHYPYRCLWHNMEVIVISLTSLISIHSNTNQVWVCLAIEIHYDQQEPPSNLTIHKSFICQRGWRLFTESWVNVC